jgi:dynein heavy chain
MLNSWLALNIYRQISEIASKEYALERSLDKMQQEWMGVTFEHKIWKETGTTILCAIDDIQTLLDDQLMKTQSMQASPYVTPFEDRVKVWLKTLTLMKKVQSPLYVVCRNRLEK